LPSRCYVNARGFNPDAKQIRPVKPKSKAEPSLRWNAKRVPIDFGPVITESAFRYEVKKNMIVVTPLPDIDPFTVTLRIDKLTGTKGATVKSVIAVDADGKNIRSVQFDTKANLANFQTRKSEFAYQVLLNRL